MILFYDLALIADNIVADTDHRKADNAKCDHHGPCRDQTETIRTCEGLTLTALEAKAESGHYDGYKAKNYQHVERGLSYHFKF